MPLDAKTKLQAFLDLVCEWFEAWLLKSPDRDLLRIAYSRLHKLSLKLERALKEQ